MKYSGAGEVADLAKRFGAATIARKLGVTETAVRKWGTGKAKPTKEKQAALRKHYGLAPGAWTAKRARSPASSEDEGPEQQTVLPKPDEQPAVDAATEAAENVRRLMQLRDKLEKDKRATPKEKAAVAAQLTSATRLHGKFTGATDVTPSQILRSPSWRALVVLLVDAVRPFPGACEAVAKTLRDYEGAST